MNRFILTGCGTKPTKSVVFFHDSIFVFILERDIYEALHFYSDI